MTAKTSFRSSSRKAPPLHTPRRASSRRVAPRLRALVTVAALVLAPLLGARSVGADADCTQTVFQPQGGLRLKIETAYEAHTTWVRTLAFHPCGGVLASAGNDGAVRYWNLSDRTLVHEFVVSSPDEGIP